MLSAVKAGKKDFFFINGRVELEIPVYIGQHHNVGRLGNYDLVVKHGYPRGDSR